MKKNEEYHASQKDARPIQRWYKADGTQRLVDKKDEKGAVARKEN